MTALRHSEAALPLGGSLSAFSSPAHVKGLVRQEVTQDLAVNRSFTLTAFIHLYLLEMRNALPPEAGKSIEKSQRFTSGIAGLFSRVWLSFSSLVSAAPMRIQAGSATGRQSLCLRDYAVSWTTASMTEHLQISNLDAQDKLPRLPGSSPDVLIRIGSKVDGLKPCSHFTAMRLTHGHSRTWFGVCSGLSGQPPKTDGFDGAS
ncbi:hypothetical protein CC2G_009848 [Coprinopsis cinerea AmutBmut pab1-1]|nr:hypothetical protein CC2G_009848 [Coprinopsis cinerea AmutBmut pab1-1]